MKVFAGHDGGSGCSYYRMELPLQELMYASEDEDIEVVFADAGDDGHPPQVTLSMLAGYDVIVAQRWNTHCGWPAHYGRCPSRWIFGRRRTCGTACASSAPTRQARP